VSGTPLDGRLLRGERARQALVAATLRIIERDGLCGVTHRNVTRQAGLPPSSAAYHFSSISDLLEQALLWADQQAAESLERIGRTPDPVAAFAAWLVEDLVEHRSRVIAEYELFLYAARVPSMRPTAVRWLTDLERLVSTWTPDGRAVSTIRAYVDGMALQAVVSGERPDAAAVEATLRYLVQRSVPGEVQASVPGEAGDLAVGARRPAGPVAGAFD
jgi:TetR/AcrR family transcriptional regulator, regulator of biofilm formation and stress response